MHQGFQLSNVAVNYYIQNIKGKVNINDHFKIAENTADKADMAHTYNSYYHYIDYCEYLTHIYNSYYRYIDCSENLTPNENLEEKKV